MRVNPKTPHILLRETYREFHRLLCLLILGYKDSLQQLAAMKVKEVAPQPSSLEPMVYSIMYYLALLHRLAYSKTIVNHFDMVAVAVRRHGYQPSVLTEWEIGDGPANAAEDNMQGTVENKGAAKGTGEDDDDDDDGGDQDHNLFPMEDDADDDGIADDDGVTDDDDDAGDDGVTDDNDDAGDDNDTDDEDNMDDDETDILDVNGLILSDSYTIWLRLQVVYFDALHTLWKLPQNNSKITTFPLHTSIIRRGLHGGV
jgi:hypothetical protein